MKKIIAEDKAHLQSLIKEEVKLHGEKCDLNHIDTSLVTDMSQLFANIKFNGDISQWDVSNVKNMTYLFIICPFNGDISNWNVSNVKDMTSMFWSSQFNGDISKWNVENVQYMTSMFSDSKFSGNISKWNVENVVSMRYILKNCNVEMPWWAIEDNDQRKEAIQKYNFMNKLDNKLISKENNISPKKMKI